MNSKILSALAIGGLLVGSALAGPGDAHPPFAYQPPKNNTVGIALFKSPKAANCPMIQEQSKTLPSVSPRNPSVTTVTGYKHEGCVTNAAGTVMCKGSNETCAAML
jgi:hypothetical protein